MSEPRTPENPIPNETAAEQDPVKTTTKAFVGRLYKKLKFYPEARKLLARKQFSVEEMTNPDAEVSTTIWNYKFRRRTPEYLTLRVERSPKDPNSGILPDVIEIVDGKHQSYAHSVSKLTPVTNTSDNPDQEPVAQMEVDAFISDIEAQF